MASWVEKYRPSTLDEFIFQSDIDELHITKFAAQGHLPHLLLSGPPGTGKTSCALMLIKMLNIDPMDTMIINASRENSVTVVRDKISDFAATAPFSSPFKVVLLDEGDMITEEGQRVMRRLTEETAESVRFIITCNHLHKIEPALISRFQHFQFKQLPIDKVLERVVDILAKEEVKWDDHSVERIINASPNDMRAIINALEQYSVSGLLVVPNQLTISSELSEAIGGNMAQGKWRQVSKYVMDNVPDPDVIKLYKIVYQQLKNVPGLSSQSNYEQAVLTLAEYLNRANRIADPYINFDAMTIELDRISRG